ncbi:hypothetical protein ACJJTC_003322 [Scirpophaga incertulas]
MPTSSAVLRDLLRKAEAAVYDNVRGIVLMGTMSGSYMAAYSDTRGFVAARSDGAEEGMYDTAPDDPVVVVAKCTRGDAGGQDSRHGRNRGGRAAPRRKPDELDGDHLHMDQRRPRMRQNTMDHSNINAESDMVITTTTEAAEIYGLNCSHNAELN